jgi:DNA-binding protein H-NS
VKANDISRWPVDELWELYQEVGTLLQDRLASELQTTQQRLRELEANAMLHALKPAARAKARFVNPSNPSQTWAGRGRMPNWLTQALAMGRSLEDYKIVAEEISSLR